MLSKDSKTYGVSTSTKAIEYELLSGSKLKISNFHLCSAQRRGAPTVFNKNSLLSILYIGALELCVYDVSGKKAPQARSARPSSLFSKAQETWGSESQLRITTPTGNMKGGS
jgi:hypothetical protein